MGRCLIKPDKDQNFYVMWSSVVDTAVGCGTREEIAEDVRDEHGRRGIDRLDTDFARADSQGTSAYNEFGGWDDEELHVMEGGGPGSLKRVDLRRYIELMCERTAEATAQAEALVTPYPPDYYD